MKKRGFSAIGVIVGVCIVALIAVAAYFIIDGNNKATRYSDYDFFSIIEPTKDNGFIGDHVKGDPEAPVVLFEFADYQCPGCASVNPRINKIVEDYGGKVALVYRNFLLSYHQNGTAAASAAEAAGLQGYWKEYADKLFAEQSEWEYATQEERSQLFNKYFIEVTNGQGDLEKFNNDINSKNVSKKISFDMGIARRVDVPATPAIYIDGQLIDFGGKNGGQVIAGDQVITWDSPKYGDEFVALIHEIIDAKLAE